MIDYVRNAWYVAGWSSEFGEALRRVTLLEEHVVMFRRLDGSVAALEDRCPHRQLPLSMGKRLGDEVQCGYHGLVFDCSGACVRVPGQSNLPAAAWVKAYPVLERHGIVWIWMGEPEKADADLCFDLPELGDPAWHTHHGDALEIEAHYLNVAENLVDPAHVSFVHPTTLGNAASENVPVHVRTDTEPLVAWRWIRDAEPIGFFKAFGGFEGNVDRWHYYYLHTPCTAVIDFGSAPTAVALQEDERGRTDKGAMRIFAIHLLTPVTADLTIDRWMHLRNVELGNEDVSERMDGLFRIAFAEDKAVLEAIQHEEKRPNQRRPIRLAIDRAPMVYRKRIAERVALERTTDAGGQPTGAFIYHD
ncbi:MAG: aromatic ring-hydroxylating dioxygenase subunit alpha [Pseudomonadota bacterium]